MSTSSTVDHTGLPSIEEEPLVGNDAEALLRPEVHDDDIEAASKLVGGKPGIWVWLLVLSAGISGLLFGCMISDASRMEQIGEQQLIIGTLDDTAIISSALLQLSNPPSKSSIPALNVSQQSIVTSITSISALISSISAGPISDYGRKKAIFLAAVVFTIGAVWQSLANSVGSLVLGRFIVGLGIGTGSAVVPMYITELSPAHLRSRLNTLNVVFITLGQIVAYLTGYLYSETKFGWRSMFLIGGIPAIVQIVLLFFLPESPRWLIQHGRTNEATKILARIYGFRQLDPTAAERRMLSRLVRSIERGVRSEHEITSARAKWKTLFVKRGNRKALLVSGGLQAFQQLCGFNALMYFSSIIYAKLNFTNPTLTSLSVAATNFTFTLLSLILIPKVGKRKLLLYSVPLMALGLLIAAFGFSRLPSEDIASVSLKHTDNESNSAGYIYGKDAPSITYPYVILFSTTFYVASYAAGIGNIPWQQAEFFPMSVRSLGTSLSTACNWSSNFIIGETFLGLMESIGPSLTFIIFTIICVLGWIGIYLGYPDTEGMNLEEIEALLSR